MLPSSPSQLPQLPALTPKRRGAGLLSRVVIGSLIGIGIVIIAVLTIHQPEDQKAEAVAEHFVLAMQSNDPDTAYALGNQAFRSATTEENLGQLFDQVEPFLAKARIEKVDSYYATSSKGDPRAIIVYTAAKNTKLTYVRLVLDKQADDDGTWLVHSMMTKAQPLQAKPE